MQIREATKNDFTAFKNLQRQIHSYHMDNRPDIYEDHDLDISDYERLLDDEHRRLLFVEGIDGEVFGYSMLKIVVDPEAGKKNMKERKVLVISEICVEQSHRGKGLGKFLLEKAVEYAKTVDADSLELGVWEFNQTAIKFYEKMGMKTQIRKLEMKLK
jgi:diamine N-acetyltransferase